MTGKVDQSGYQLNKKELLAEVPLMAKGLVGALIDWLNSEDMNHDGKADMCQYAPLVIKAMPIVMAILPYVDMPKLQAWLLSHDFIKNAVKVEAELAKLIALMPKG